MVGSSRHLDQWHGLMVWPRSFRWSSPRPNIANMYCTECIIGIIQNVHVLHRMYYRCHRERPCITGSHFGQYHGGVFSPYANMYCTECIIGIIQNVQDAMDIRAAAHRRGGTQDPLLFGGPNRILWWILWRILIGFSGGFSIAQESVFLFTMPSGQSAYFLCPAAQRRIW